MTSKSQLGQEIETMKEYVQEVNNVNSQKRDCLKDKKEMNVLFDKLQKELLDLRDDHRNSKERIRHLETTIATKVETSELKLVQEHLEMLPTKDEVMTLRNFMKNSVEKFQTDNDNFSKEFTAHLAIIRRYDEVISEKASKHSVYHTE